MTNVKLLRANMDIILVAPERVEDFFQPKAVELNDRYDPVTNPDGLAFWVSCATADDYTANQTDSETSTFMTVCDVQEVETPTFRNYEVSLDFLRDIDLAPEGLYNISRETGLGPDVPWFVYVRIGKKQGEPFATDGTDIVKGFEVATDFPVHIVESNELLRHGARYYYPGRVLPRYEVNN